MNPMVSNYFVIIENYLCLLILLCHRNTLTRNIHQQNIFMKNRSLCFAYKKVVNFTTFVIPSFLFYFTM